MGNGGKHSWEKDYHGQRPGSRREPTRGVGVAGAKQRVCGQEARRDEEGNTGGAMTLE